MLRTILERWYVIENQASGMPQGETLNPVQCEEETGDK